MTQSRGARWLGRLFLVALVLVEFGPLLSFDGVSPATPWGMTERPALAWSARALDQGSLPHWTREILGGTPLLAVPTLPTLYPPAILALWTLSDVDVALHALLLVHLVAGAWAMAGVLRRLGAGGIGAVVGAAIYLRFLSMTLAEPHVLFGWVHLPIALWVLMHGLATRRPSLGGVWAGAVLAHAFLSGSVFAVLVMIVFLILVAGRRSIAPPRPAGLKESIDWLLPCLAVLLGLGAVRLLPTMEWLPFTSAVEPIQETLEPSIVPLFSPEAIGGIAELGWIALVLAAAGVLLGIRNGDRLLLAAAALVAVLLGRASVLETFDSIPLLRTDLDGMGAASLLTFAVAALAGLGFGDLARLLGGGSRAVAGPSGTGDSSGGAVPSGGPTVPAMGRPGIAIGLAVVVLLLDLGHVLPGIAGGTPETVAAPGVVSLQGTAGRRIEALGRVSARELAGRNELFLRVAARTEPLERLTQYETAGLAVPPTAQTLSSETGVPLLEGRLGRVYVPFLHRFLLLGRISYPRVWGVLGVAWISAESELDMNGLEEVAVVREDPDADPPYADGPRLYRNEEVSPPAWLAESFLLMRGRGVDCDDSVRGVITYAKHQPRAIPLVQVPVEEEPALVAAFGGPEGYRMRVRGQPSNCGDASTGQFTNPFEKAPRDDPQHTASHADGSTHDESDHETAGALPPISPPEPLRLRWTGPNRIVLEGDALASGGMAVVAETIADWPGWSVVAVGENGSETELPLYRAQGVATAIPVPERTLLVNASYRTPGYALGGAITCGAILVLIVAGFAGAFRPETKGTPGTA